MLTSVASLAPSCTICTGWSRPTRIGPITVAPPSSCSSLVEIEAVKILDQRRVDFEYDGEMAADVALNPEAAALYPFSRLAGPANVLIMPGLQSANISAKLLRELAGQATIGPMLIGMEKPVQVAPMTAIAPDLLTLAVLAAAGIAG